MKNDIFREISNKLNRDIEYYLRAWLPNGRREDNEYTALNPTRNDKNLGSFKISLKSGKWIDFATGDKGGDIISLYAYVNGITQSEALLALTSKDSYNYNMQYRRRSPAKVAKVAKPSQNPTNLLIAKLWKEAYNAKGSIVERYLLNRGYSGIIPDRIKCHPNLLHTPTNQSYPSMLCAVTLWPNYDTVIGLHRTFLDKETLYKANIINNKMMLGKVTGGAVMLALPGKTLILTEGIETALSVYLATNLSSWATLSTSGLESIKLPDLSITQEIIIGADNDKAGNNAANKLALRLLDVGYVVRIAKPNLINSDFNDLLRR